jgi:hypothetical protein
MLVAAAIVGWLLASVLRLSRQVKTYRVSTFSESRTIGAGRAATPAHPRPMSLAPGLGDVPLDSARSPNPRIGHPWLQARIAAVFACFLISALLLNRV